MAADAEVSIRVNGQTYGGKADRIEFGKPRRRTTGTSTPR
jgi:hypothetical protein